MVFIACAATTHQYGNAGGSNAESAGTWMSFPVPAPSLQRRPRRRQVREARANANILRQPRLQRALLDLFYEELTNRSSFPLSLPKLAAKNCGELRI